MIRPIRSATIRAGRLSRRGVRRFVRRSDRPRVLVAIDVCGWAHDYKSQNLRQQLSSELDLIVVPQNEVFQRDLDQADLTVVYYWMQVEILLGRGLRLPKNLLIGTCEPTEFGDEDHIRRGTDLINEYGRAVFANCALLVDQTAGLFEVPTYYTPNGVNTTLFSPSSDCGPASTPKLRVGWAGSLTNHGPKRGYHDFIVPAVEAANAILLTAASEDKNRGREEMREFYRSLDVYICASSSEGTPNPCLEAAACGIPLVTTPVGNMPEFVTHGENGLIVERDTEAIAAALLLLAADPDRRANMGRAARATAERWDWQHQAVAYRQLFRDALPGGNLRHAQGR